MKRDKVIELRKEHPEWSLSRIALEVGVSRQRVYHILAAAIARGEQIETSSKPRVRGGGDQTVYDWPCGYCGTIFRIPKTLLTKRLKSSKSGALFCSHCRGKHRRLTSSVYQLLKSLEPGMIKLLDYDLKALQNLRKASGALRNEGYVPAVRVGLWDDKILIWREHEDFYCRHLAS